ncbi:MAG: hypothetical protein Tsb0020_20130 [Haliangiales bacterium]
MKTLTLVPAQTHPPSILRGQRHQPRPGAYRSYRDCLRWDAGFTCCICLIHESDLAPPGPGVEGTGLTSVEHIEPQTRSPELRDVYVNCAYVCRFCNTARGDKPVNHASGARLLNPWRDVWGHHFRLEDDHLIAADSGPEGDDARYTARSYKINDPKRVAMRKQRRVQLAVYISLLGRDVSEAHTLATQQPPSADRHRLLRIAQKLANTRQHAIEELRRRSAIPSDAPTRCRCDDDEHHCLHKAINVLQVSLA